MVTVYWVKKGLWKSERVLSNNKCISNRKEGKCCQRLIKRKGLSRKKVENTKRIAKNLEINLRINLDILVFINRIKLNELILLEFLVEINKIVE